MSDHIFFFLTTWAKICFLHPEHFSHVWNLYHENSILVSSVSFLWSSSEFQLNIDDHILFLLTCYLRVKCTQNEYYIVHTATEYLHFVSTRDPSMVVYIIPSISLLWAWREVEKLICNSGSSLQLLKYKNKKIIHIVWNLAKGSTKLYIYISGFRLFRQSFKNKKSREQV